MSTFLQPVDLPERCFLQEVLYWVAFQRLPLASYTPEGNEIRNTEEVGGYSVEITDRFLSEGETVRAGIPPDPDLIALLEDRSTLPVARYDDLLGRNNLDDDIRRELEIERDAAVAFEKKQESWLPHYKRAIEYPASKIFVALRDGSLRARGRLLPGADLALILSDLQATEQDIFDFPISDVPPSFWSLQGINFDASAAGNGTHCYCHVSCYTHDVLSVFPGERTEVTGVTRIGDSFVLTEQLGAVRSGSGRGRPPYPWDAFHLELAHLLRGNELPEKKEAAIEYFRSWFQRVHGIKAGRSVVGEKLKPYYDKFVKSGGQKIP